MQDPSEMTASELDPAPEASEEGDAVSFLLFEHRKLARLLSDLSGTAASGDTGSRELWHQVIREAATHEEAEDQVVYPRLRSDVPGGDAIADARLEEEQGLKEMLSELDGMNPGDEGFQEALSRFRSSVLTHARNEEREVFPRLRQAFDADTLTSLGGALRTAKRVAPTRPHPAAPNTPPGNVVAGMAAGVVDRARDVGRAVGNKLSGER